MDTTRRPGNAPVQKQGLEAEDTSFLVDMAGSGLEDISSNEMSQAYLAMVQPGSSAESDDNKAGTWRNSATGRNYGNVVRVIPVAFRTIWNERSSEPPYSTIANYAPNSIEVEIKQPPKGQRGFAKMYNKESGNEIKELYIYAVVLPDFPEDGVLYFNPTVSSMRACKSWNTQLKQQLLPNGVQAPIFGFSWQLVTELIQNPKQANLKIAVLSKIVKDVITDKDTFTNSISPQLSTVRTNVLQVGVDSSATEEE